MKKIVGILVLAAAVASSNVAVAGIFGHRWRQPAGGNQYPQQGGYNNNYQGAYQQPASGPSRSYSYQPRSGNIYPFDSRASPKDWPEAHRGYGVKIRGW